MLEYTVDLIEQTFEQCLAIYLHVAEYNQAAIKFYAKNLMLSQLDLIQETNILTKFQQRLKIWDSLLMATFGVLEFRRTLHPWAGKELTGYD